MRLVLRSAYLHYCSHAEYMAPVARIVRRSSLDPRKQSGLPETRGGRLCYR